MDIDINLDADLVTLELENQARELEELYHASGKHTPDGKKRCMKPFCADFDRMDRDVEATQMEVEAFDVKFEQYKKEAE